MIPQTWESTAHRDQSTGALGDNDPLDIVELNPRNSVRLGESQFVKVLGAWCLLDQGELDWKVVTVRGGTRESRAGIAW